MSFLNKLTVNQTQRRQRGWQKEVGGQAGGTAGMVKSGLSCVHRRLNCSGLRFFIRPDQEWKTQMPTEENKAEREAKGGEYGS